ncbi:insulinase family protein, partial [Lactobacillus reuteri]|nr:insulinase family protein [Limosilactobacillus reuteri]
LFNQTKKIIRMNALLSEDHALTLVEQHFNKVIFGDKNISLEDWLDKIEKVTKKDVCRIARQVKLQSLFFLEGVS